MWASWTILHVWAWVHLMIHLAAHVNKKLPYVIFHFHQFDILTFLKGLWGVLVVFGGFFFFTNQRQTFTEKKDQKTSVSQWLLKKRCYIFPLWHDHRMTVEQWSLQQLMELHSEGPEIVSLAGSHTVKFRISR